MTTETSVPFFTDDITIIPHTVKDSADIPLLDRKVTIREFARGEPVRLVSISDGELRAEVGTFPMPGYRFMTGPEA